ncbi:MAG: FMN-binding protein [Halanaerobiaceae bacterium]|nr:FMN-binding protein [Halanaerobiaceae bacterium]
MTEGPGNNIWQRRLYLMKNKRYILIVLFILTIAGSILGLRFYQELETYRKQVSEIEIFDIDLSEIPDGEYTGSYEVKLVSAEVKVLVKNHEIIDIILLSHHHGRGGAAEVIPDRVVEEQSLQVDMISGATSSSKVILKAIENAFKNR